MPQLATLLLAILLTAGQVRPVLGFVIPGTCLTSSEEANAFCSSSAECELVLLDGECTPILSYSLAQELKANGTIDDTSVSSRIANFDDPSSTGSTTCESASGDVYDLCRAAEGCEVVYDPSAGCVLDIDTNVAAQNTSLAKREVWYEARSIVGRNRVEFGTYQPRWAFHKTCYDTGREWGTDQSHYIYMGTSRPTSSGDRSYDIVGHGEGRYYGWDTRTRFCDSARELVGANERQERKTFWHAQWRIHVQYTTWTIEDYISITQWVLEDGRNPVPGQFVTLWVQPQYQESNAWCTLANSLATAAGIFSGTTGGILGILVGYACA